MIYWEEKCGSCGTVKTMCSFDKKPHMVIAADGDVLFVHTHSPAHAVEEYATQRNLTLESVRKAYKCNLLNVYCEMNEEIHKSLS